jgi:hypothetical protein
MDSYLRHSYAFSPHAATLTFSTINMNRTLPAEQVPFKIAMPHQGVYDTTNTMMGVANSQGQVLAIPSEQTNEGEITGTLDVRTVDRLTQHEDTAGPTELHVFTANRIINTIAPQLQTSVSRLSDGSWVPVTALSAGKRIALLVHGIAVHLDAILPLAKLVATLHDANGNLIYDTVIGFEYTSNALLADIGNTLCTSVSGLLPDGCMLDVFAHSMGNLVARYAFETPHVGGGSACLYGRVSRFVGLAGPHAGLPFGNQRFLQSLLFAMKTDYLVPCLEDMVTDGPDGPPTNPFLINLNSQPAIPGKLPKYYTLSGSAFQDYPSLLRWPMR